MNYEPVTEGEVEKGDQIKGIHEAEDKWRDCISTIGIKPSTLASHQFRRPVEEPATFEEPANFEPSLSKEVVDDLTKLARLIKHWPPNQGAWVRISGNEKGYQFVIGSDKDKLPANGYYNKDQWVAKCEELRRVHLEYLQSQHHADEVTEFKADECCCGESDKTWIICKLHGRGTKYDNDRLEAEKSDNKPMFATVADIPEHISWAADNVTQWAEYTIHTNPSNRALRLDEANHLWIGNEWCTEHQWQEARRMLEADKVPSLDADEALGKKLSVYSDKPAQEWDGESIPPVGTICEVTAGSPNWHEFFILYLGDKSCFARAMSSGAEQQLYYSDVEFRPIITQAQRDAQNKATAISTMRDTVNAEAGEEFMMSEAYEILYDNGYRLTEPE